MNRLISIALFGILASCNKESDAPAPQPLPVTVGQPVKRVVLVHEEFPSTLTGAQEIEIRARVSGILSLVPDAPNFAGQRVEKGTPLFIIEPEPYAQQTQAAQAAVDRATAARDLAQDRFDRLGRLKNNKSVSEIDVEIAASELAEAEAAISQAKAELKRAQINEGYTIIKAPITGRMSRILVDPGNLVGSKDSTLLATIIDDSKIHAYFEVPERIFVKYLEARGTGKNLVAFEKDIRLRLVDGSQHSDPGRIDYIANKVDPSTRTAKVRAIFENNKGELSSGMYGLIGYPVGPKPGDPSITEALLIPSVAIQRDLGGNFVWVVDNQNIVRRRAIEAGDAIEKPVTDPNAARTMETVVLKGLSGDEKVIVSGLQRAREGAPVTPVPASTDNSPTEKSGTSE